MCKFVVASTTVQIFKFEQRIYDDHLDDGEFMQHAANHYLWFILSKFL